MTNHVDWTELADADAGLLPEAESARVAAHTQVCPECGKAARAVADVPATLAQAPARPMPADVADLLVATVRHEASRAAKAARKAEKRASRGVHDPAGEPAAAHLLGTPVEAPL